jgi:hypothetical protein
LGVWPEEEEGGVGWLGRKEEVAQERRGRGSRPVAKISKENRDGLPWPLGRIDGLNRRACRNCFQIYFKDFDSNQRVLNIFKPNLNRTQNSLKFKNFSELFISGNFEN